MNFLLSLLHSEHIALNDSALFAFSIAVACALSLAIMFSFMISKKFVDTELNKLKEIPDTKFDRIIVLCSAVVLSTIVLLACILLIEIITKYMSPYSEIILCDSYNKLMVIFSTVLILSYTLTAPNHPSLRFMDLSNEESTLLCKKLFRMTTVSFTITIFETALVTILVSQRHQIICEYFFSALMVVYYFAETQFSKNLLRKCFAIAKTESYSMSAKFTTFINEKFTFLLFLGMSSVVAFNYASHDWHITFFENLEDICSVLFMMLILQMAISSIINRFLKKLKTLDIGIHTKRSASKRQKNLIWICDVLVMITYIFIICGILQYFGINVQGYVFHDKTMTVAWTAFITIIIFKGFNEFTDAVLEKAEKNNDGNYRIKLQTFLPTLSIAFNFVLFCTAILIALANLGVNVAPILATFTVFSAAIGLAAKDIIQSFIQGITLLIEKDLFIGDDVKINDMEGVIEKLSARVIYLRNSNGSVHIIPYNLVNTVTNYSRDYMHYADELCIDSKQNIAEVENMLTGIVKEMRKEEKYSNTILSDVTIYGLKPFDMAGLKIFWGVKTSPDVSGKNLKYEIYRRLNSEFNKHGIPIPVSNSIILESSK